MAQCLVLGANGFLGSHLVDALIVKGHQVRAFDRYLDEERKFLAHDNVEVYKGDFLNRRDIAKALKAIDYVFHFISTTTPITSENDPLIDINTNIRMSVQLFQETLKVGVKKVIFASTGGAIYGANNNLEQKEDYLPQPISPYAIGKLTIEHYLRYFKIKHKLDSVTYRISNPYGERQPLNAKQGVIPIFLQQIANDQPITIHGDGLMVRDYIYIKDVVDLIIQSFESAQQNLYNLGSGQGNTIDEVVKVIKEVVKKPVTIIHKDTPSTFVKKSILDIHRFYNEFGLKPHVSLSTGIKNTWDDIQAKLKH